MARSMFPAFLWNHQEPLNINCKTNDSDFLQHLARNFLSIFSTDRSPDSDSPKGVRDN